MTALVGNNSTHSKLSVLSDDARKLLRQQIVPGASDLECEYFLAVAEKSKLDWVSKQIYGIMRNEKQSDGSYSKKLTIQIGVDGYRVIAQRSGNYKGQTMPEFINDTSGQWQPIALSNSPIACRVGVYVAGFDQIVWGIAYMSEVNQKNSMWAKMPLTMISKCAEVSAIRKAFPNDTSLFENETEEMPTNMQQIIEIETVYNGTNEQKRHFVALIQRIDSSIQDPLRLQEISNQCLGCPLSELHERIIEVMDVDKMPKLPLDL